MPSVIDEIVARQMAQMPMKPKNPDGAITQGSWLDFNPVIRAMIGGLSEMLGTAPSKRVVERLSQLQSPVLRPQSGFEWADYRAGLAADTIQTGMAGADLAALAPIVGRRAGQSLMNELGQVDVRHGSKPKLDIDIIEGNFDEHIKNPEKFIDFVESNIGKFGTSTDDAIGLRGIYKKDLGKRELGNRGNGQQRTCVLPCLESLELKKEKNCRELQFFKLVGHGNIQAMTI